MTKISEMFKDEITEIGEALKKIDTEKCIVRYCDYISQDTKVLSEIERDFVLRLRRRSVDFVAELFRARDAKLDKLALLEKIMRMYKDGYYGLTDRTEENGIYDVLDGEFFDADIHVYIVCEMQTVFNTMVEEMNITKEESEKAKIQRAIDENKALIERSKKVVAAQENNIKELEIKLKSFENQKKED